MLKRLTLLLLALVLLTGCFEVSEEITINGDGSGRVIFDVSLDNGAAKLLSLGQDSGTFFDRAELEKRLSESENVERHEVRENVEGNLRKTTIDVSVKDITAEMKGLGDLADDSVKDKLDVGEGTGENPPFTVTKLENGNFKFVQQIAEGSGGGKVNPLLSGMFSGKYFRVKVNGKIVSSNGTIAEDRNSVSWEIPVAQLVNGKSVFKKLEAEVEGARPGKAVAVLTVIVIVFGLILIGLVILRRRLLS